MLSFFKFSEPVLTGQTSIRNKLVNYSNADKSAHSTHIKPIKALTFGEALFDIIKGSAHLGGAPLNLAAHLAKLGAKPAVITAVGKDELGKILACQS